MAEKTKWEVDNIKGRLDKHDLHLKENDKHLNELEAFKTSTIEKLKTIFRRLKEIEKSSKWVSQSFFYLLFSGVITAVVTFVGWLIQG